MVQKTMIFKIKRYIIGILNQLHIDILQNILQAQKFGPKPFQAPSKPFRTTSKPFRATFKPFRATSEAFRG